ncbi:MULTISPECIES: PAS domain S-box protein [Halorussus]|uniref:PAS domain S-box protein n=1 Tax=Halorussus TaxID=1070314 RepID=UPI0020A03BAD|nr:PAS domain S-box protein [Halorussus vallis]USZ75290.1 PAS domain S-box protein [Halorussus vallis]
MQLDSSSSGGPTIPDAASGVAYDPVSFSRLGGDDFYRDFVERTADVILTVDQSSSIVFANPAVEHVFGYDPESLIGESLTALMPEQFRSEYLAAVDRYVSSEETEFDWDYVEFPGLGRDGDELELAVSFSEQRVDGESFFTAVVRDISDRKARKAQLTRYETIVNSIDEGVYQLDADGTFVAVNDAVVEKTGYDREALLGANASMLVSDADAERVRAATRRLRGNGESTETLEVGVRTADGGRIPCEIRLRPLVADGAVEGTVGIVRDLSERREREQALRREKDLTRRLLETAPTALAVQTADGDLEMANQRARDLFSLADESLREHSLDELTGWKLYDADGEPLADDERPSARVRATGEAVDERELMVESPEGTRRWLRVNAAPVFEPGGDLSRVIVAAEDVTERKRYERDLEAKSQHLQSELEQALGRVTDAVFAVDPDWRFTYVNERAEQFLERAESDLLGTSVWKAFPEAVDSTFEREYRAAMETQEPTGFEEYFPPLDTWFEVRAYPSETGLSVYFRDVNERKRRERELEQYEAVVETSADGIYALDPDGNFVMANDAFLEMVGWERERLLGKPAKVVHDGEISELADELASGIWSGDDAEARLELELVARDGSTLPVESRFGPYPYDDERWGRCGIVRDVTGRKERERELRERVRQQRAIAEFSKRALEDRPLDDLFDEACELVADTLEHDYCKVLELFPEDDELLLRNGVGWNEGIVGSAAVDDDRGSQAGFTLISEEPVVVEDLENETRFSGPELLTSHDVKSGISTIIGTPAEPWGILGTHHTERRSYDDHDVHFVQSVAHILTMAIRRRQRERTLESLAEASGELLRAETRGEVCDIVAETANDDLSLSLTMVACYDDATGELEPRSLSPQAEAVFDAERLLAPEADLAWRAFAENRVTTFGGLPAGGESAAAAADSPAPREEGPSPAEDDDVATAYDVAVFPLGRYGILVVGATHRDEDAAGAAADDGDGGTEIGAGGPPLTRVLGSNAESTFVRILAANTESALDRTDRERQILEREELLREQNERLERLNRINDVIRRIDKALVAAGSQVEIEQEVCSQLTSTGPYAFAWLGDYDAVGEEIRPREYAGADKGYLDSVSFAAADASPENPFLTAVRTREPQVVGNLLGDPPFEDWRSAALKRGYRSCIVLPLLYKDTLYGVLAVYADQAEAFDDLERDVLAELAGTVGYAINAVESKKALVSTDFVEIEFSVRDPDVPFVDLTNALDCEFEFESVTATSDGAFRVFFETRGADPEAVREYLGRAVEVRDLRLVSASGDQASFACVVEPTNFVPTLLDYGAIPRTFTAVDGEGTAIVTFPQSGDVRRFLEAVQTRYDGLELLARREHEREFRTREDFRTQFDDSLTDRQREVLRTAYFGGFFETPRQSTGSEIGETLGISQPTFNKHLRAAQRKLFGLLYDD